MTAALLELVFLLGERANFSFQGDEPAFIRQCNPPLFASADGFGAGDQVLNALESQFAADALQVIFQFISI